VRSSTDRILTTHVGSLPRSSAVVEMLFARENGEPYDAGAFDRVMTAAVAETVKRQVGIGLDSVSDGETSKISYATYIKDRLSGFAGDNERLIAADLQPYPEFRAKLALFAGKQSFKRQSCVGPIAVVEREALRKDLANLRAAVDGSGAQEAFMNAASPGVVAAFQPNNFYRTHEDYLEAIANAMREEYESILAAGFVLQLDCPDLAMARAAQLALRERPHARVLGKL
jgi:5-methyltetrahydropteroyltriglutamate--homocysteine methyltransferase